MFLLGLSVKLRLKNRLLIRFNLNRRIFLIIKVKKKDGRMYRIIRENSPKTRIMSSLPNIVNSN